MNKSTWNRFLLAAAGLMIVSTASAHFAYIVPATEGTGILVVFSDSLEPDLKVPIEKIAATTLVYLDATGKATPIKLKKGKHALEGQLPDKDVRVIGGISDYGFHQSKHTQFKAVRLKYYPKAIRGDLAAAEKIRLGDKALLEILPVVNDGQIRFQALLKGKPLADAEFGVIVPGQTKGFKGKGDNQGLTKVSFSKAGKYGVRVGFTEPIAGEINGKKYDEVRHYATLVLDFAP